VSTEYKNYHHYHIHNNACVDSLHIKQGQFFQHPYHHKRFDLHYLPFDPIQKDGSNQGNVSGTNHCEGLDIIMFNEEHK
jgi:hypothetical protein